MSSCFVLVLIITLSTLGPQIPDVRTPIREESVGQKLAKECKAIFDTASLSHGSLWGRVSVFLPEFTSLIVLLSKVFPDKAHIQHMKVNTFLRT